MSRLVREVEEAVDAAPLVLWKKSDLHARLAAGESMPPFFISSGDPTSVSYEFDWSRKWKDEKSAGAERTGGLRFGYEISSDGDARSVRGNVSWDVPATETAPSPAREGDPAVVTPDTGAADQATVAAAVDAGAVEAPPLIVPAVVPLEDENLPPDELLAAMAEQVKSTLDSFAASSGLTSAVDFRHSFALLILHETVEVGIIDHYIKSSDRRWLCDGVANYAAWQIACDRAGETEAREVFDLEDVLGRAAAERDRVNLRSWLAVEAQDEAATDRALEQAHYAYATQAVFLMTKRHGADFPARLFREIGRTPRDQTDMKTVERAYQKLTRKKLRRLLADAVKR